LQGFTKRISSCGPQPKPQPCAGQPTPAAIWSSTGGNLAEEIESLGTSQRRELRSRIDVILEHLIKLEKSLAIAPSAGWLSTIGRERSSVEYLLADSPSLKSEAPLPAGGERG
jgi:hypothetical protein